MLIRRVDTAAGRLQEWKVRAVTKEGEAVQEESLLRERKRETTLRIRSTWERQMQTKIVPGLGSIQAAV